MFPKHFEQRLGDHGIFARLKHEGSYLQAVVHHAESDQ